MRLAGERRTLSVRCVFVAGVFGAGGGETSNPDAEACWRLGLINQLNERARVFSVAAQVVHDVCIGLDYMVLERVRRKGDRVIPDGVRAERSLGNNLTFLARLVTKQ